MTASSCSFGQQQAISAKEVGYPLGAIGGGRSFLSRLASRSARGQTFLFFSNVIAAIALVLEGGISSNHTAMVSQALANQLGSAHRVQRTAARPSAVQNLRGWAPSSLPTKQRRSQASRPAGQQRASSGLVVMAAHAACVPLPHSHATQISPARTPKTDCNENRIRDRRPR